MVRKARVGPQPDPEPRAPDPGVAAEDVAAEDAAAATPSPGTGLADAAPEDAAAETGWPDSAAADAAPEDADDPDAQLREVLAGPPPADGPPPSRPSRTATPAIILAVLVLVGSAAAAITFAAFTGGLQLPTSAPTDVAVVHPTPGASTSTPAPTLPSIPPTATTAPTPEPTAASTPAPTSDRFALLVPCPSTPDCYIYTIRRGDNLSSIAHYFGVSLDAIKVMNPGLTTPIQPGTAIKLPPPTR